MAGLLSFKRGSPPEVAMFLALNRAAPDRSEEAGGGMALEIMPGNAKMRE